MPAASADSRTPASASAPWSRAARDHGALALAGVLLSALAAGIGLGGLLYGLRPHGPAAARYPAACPLAAAGPAPPIAAPGLAAMTGLALLAGLCFAPATVTQVAVIDELAPAGRRAEAFTWLGTGYAAGSATGAAVAGQLLDAGGARTVFAAACAVGLLAWL